MNELASLISSYFPNNIEAASELGAITILHNPDSKKSISHNSDDVYIQILHNFRKQKKPLILVGHSKGGAETFAAILEHPELVLNGIV